MIRLLARLLVWPLLLVLFVLLLLPLTGTGSGWLLRRLGDFTPLEIEYTAGRLAGELQLARVSWSDEDIRLDLYEAVLELDLRCLWRSAVCLQQLQAQRLELAVLPDESAAETLMTAGVADPETGPLLAFPFPVEAPYLQLGELAVRWQGGQWRQGALDGGVVLSGSTIHVARAAASDALLHLTETGEASQAPVELPQVDLPLILQVDALSLQRARWNLYGEEGSLQSLQLRGNWRNTHLVLDALQLRSAEWGEAVAAGTLDFQGQWPVALGADLFPADTPQWPDLVERHLRLDVKGTLDQLVLQLQATGGVTAAASAQVNVLDPALPFLLSVDADWPGQLELAGRLELPEALAGSSLTAPLRFSANGALQEQWFQLETAGSVPGYPSLELDLSGRHEAGLLALEDLRLLDRRSADTLWGRGELRYGERTAWSLALETGGLDLPPIDEAVAGRLEGQLQFDGWLEADAWELALSGIALRGEINRLPAQIDGRIGLASDLSLLPSDLEADLNGTRARLFQPRELQQPGRLEIEVDDLGRWLKGSRGRLSLRATPDRLWRQVTLEGFVEDLLWQGLTVHSGRLQGRYGRPGDEFQLELALEDLELGELALERLTLKGHGDGREQAFSLRTVGELAGELAVAGGYLEGGRWRGQLDATSLQTPEGTWHLPDPVPLGLALQPASLEVAAHCWYYRQARICPGAAVLGATGEATIALAGGFDLLSAFLPPYLEVGGELDADLALSWSPEQPLDLQGEVRASGLQLSRQLGGGESARVSFQALNATIGRGARGLELVAALLDADQRRAVLEVRLPGEREGALDGSLELNGLQLDKLSPLFIDLAALEGELGGALVLGGTLDTPLVEGELRLQGGRLALLGNPTELAALELQIEAAGDRLLLSGGGLLGGGELDIDGELLSRPDWRLALAVTGGRHEILIPPYTRMTVSEELKLALTLAEIDLRGRVTVHEGVLEHEQLPEGSVDLSDDVVEVDLQGNIVRENGVLENRIDIALLLEDNFRVVGDMVNATLGGDLQLLQTPGKPLQLFGNLNVIGGELRAYQQRLRIQRGTVSFSGPAENPELDVSAQREIPADKVVVGISLRGTLEQPRLDVFSDPVMSQANTMSYLIRGRPVDTGAAADGMATALSLGTGLVNETPLVSQLNEIPGISNLAFGAEGSEEDIAATVGGYIGERLYLSYGMGIYEPINVLTARLYLQTRLWLEVVSRLENSVDLYYSFDID